MRTLDKTQEMTDKLTEAIDIFGEAIDMINPTTPDLESANTRLQKSLDETAAAAARSFRKAAAYATNAVYNLRGAIVLNDSEKISQAFKDILSAVQKMSDEKQKRCKYNRKAMYINQFIFAKLIFPNLLPLLCTMMHSKFHV